MLLLFSLNGMAQEGHNASVWLAQRLNTPSADVLLLEKNHIFNLIPNLIPLNSLESIATGVFPIPDHSETKFDSRYEMKTFTRISTNRTDRKMYIFLNNYKLYFI